jgi:hypothetical protein
MKEKKIPKKPRQNGSVVVCRCFCSPPPLRSTPTCLLPPLVLLNPETDISTYEKTESVVIFSIAFYLIN